jgi:hypothetical protein
MQLGSPFKAPKPLTLGPSGFGGASITLQPLLGWRETMTPKDVRACIAVLSWSGRFLRGDRERYRRPEHFFIQPVVPGVAFGSYLKAVPPSDQWTRKSAYPVPAWRTSPSLFQPGGLWILDILRGWFAH